MPVALEYDFSNCAFRRLPPDPAISDDDTDARAVRDDLSIPRVPSATVTLDSHERAFIELAPLRASVAMALVDGGRVDEGDAFAGDECVVPKLFTLMLDSARCVHRQRHDTAVLPASRCGPTARLDPRRASR
jgi:hypothetical protein